MVRRGWEGGTKGKAGGRAGLLRPAQYLQPGGKGALKAGRVEWGGKLMVLACLVSGFTSAGPFLVSFSANTSSYLAQSWTFYPQKPGWAEGSSLPETSSFRREGVDLKKGVVL